MEWLSVLIFYEMGSVCQGQFFRFPHIHKKRCGLSGSRDVTDAVLPTPDVRPGAELTRNRRHPYNQPTHTGMHWYE